MHFALSLANTNTGVQQIGQIYISITIFSWTKYCEVRPTNTNNIYEYDVVDIAQHSIKAIYSYADNTSTIFDSST